MKCQTIVWLSIFSILMCFPTSCPCLVHVKHQVSIIPILLYFRQIPWPPGNNVCSLYQNFSLQLAFPPHNSYTLCVSGNTLIKVKHNIRAVFLPLPAWGFLQLIWTFSISLPTFLQIFQMVHQDIHVYMTALQQCFLLCFLVTCLNNICYNFHALRMNSFMLWGRQCILHSTQTQIKTHTHTKIYTNTLNMQKSNMYIYKHKHTHSNTPNVLVANVFGVGIFHWHLVP